MIASQLVELRERGDGGNNRGSGFLQALFSKARVGFEPKLATPRTGGVIMLDGRLGGVGARPWTCSGGGGGRQYASKNFQQFLTVIGWRGGGSSFRVGRGGGGVRRHAFLIPLQSIPKVYSCVDQGMQMRR